MQTIKTDLELKLNRQIKQVYSILMKFGYPGFVSQTVAQKEEDIEKQMSDFFQPSPKRYNLIEWLILTINPLYSQEINTKNNKKRTILNNLWKLGVLPFSRHTHNLDYEKYLQGLLGYENAVNLIYNLCVLLKEHFQLERATEDTKFNGCLEQLIKNYDNLVNNDYDPYKVSFPPAYQDLSEQEFNQQYQQVMRTLCKSQINENLKSSADSYEVMFRQFEENKARFQTLYAQLVSKMQTVVEENSGMIQNWQQMETFQGRTLKISQTLTHTYRLYKDKIRLGKLNTSQLATDKDQIKSLIDSLNEAVYL